MQEMVLVANAPAPVFINKTLQTATNKVFRIGETVRKCAYETAFIMAQVDATECYKDDGFNNVHEWAMKTFGFKKSASYTLLRVGKEYTRTITGANGKVKGYGSNLLTGGDRDFTTTQIEKMLPGGHDLAVELVESEKITPAMTCKEIEKVIKSHTSNDADEPTETEETGETETKETQDEPEMISVWDKDGAEYQMPVDVLNKYRID